MFSKRLKELRESSNLSMDKVIELYNNRFNGKMNKSTLSRYENNVQEPMYTVVVNLAKLFGVSVDYLSGADTYTQQEPPILTKYNRLNSEGKEKTDSYVDDLLINPKYTIETNLDRTVFGHKTFSRAAAAPDVTTHIDKRKKKRNHT